MTVFNFAEVEDDSKILQPIDEALFFSKFPRSSRLQVPPEAEKLKRMTKAAEDENQKSEVRAIKNEDSSLKSVKEKRLQKPVAGVSKNLDLSVQESIKEQSLQTRNKVGINNKGEPFEKKNSKDLKRSVCHSPNKYATGVSPKKQCLDYEVLNNTSMSSTRKKTGSLPWVDKYKPTSLQHLVGQNGEKSPMNKLLAWLRGWYHLHIGEGASVKKARPPPWLSQSDGSSFKAVLLSGVPGVGKTTCAIMACKELNLEYVEMNASEVRNKKNLEATVAELIGCRQMDEFFGKKHQSIIDNDAVGLTHVLIMDEVDGMSGNEDRAGIAELIQMIKTTRIPIICICNDRQSQKMQTFYARMLTIACQEKFAVSKELLDDIIEASNHDVRQTIYNLQLLSYGGKNVQSKDCAVNVFEAARRLLSAETSLIDKQRMFFTDYTLMPLFVQENYPNIGSSKTSKYEALENLRRAADCISLGDIVDKSIRSAGTWSLLNELSMFSSALPAAYMNGHLKVMINFPSWLGKTSSTNKRFRLLRQLSSHCYSKIPNGHSSLNVDYISFLRDRICWPLVDNKVDGISSVIATYNYYNLLKIDAEAIVELAAWPGMKDPASKIEPKAFSAFLKIFSFKFYNLLISLLYSLKNEMALDEEGNVVDLGNSSDDSVVENDENEEIAAPLKAVVSKGKS
ncbi:unnamed protein product [Dracunculus medinensis]|uniref:AAA+ ATPase domain-containing protein n=1 Tax=Dracunculus medinensis TaxID=318479 RepID=A0A3P7SW90_DRAME|nr:unnamed protein product [Dracunculus medinensis]